MTRSDKAQLFCALTHEARENRECVVCGFPLRHGTGRLPVKCQRPECLRAYNAMYRRLKRVPDVVAK